MSFKIYTKKTFVDKFNIEPDNYILCEKDDISHYSNPDNIIDEFINLKFR